MREKGGIPPIPPLVCFFLGEEGYDGIDGGDKSKSVGMDCLRELMASPRKSRRLNGDRSEIVDTKFRCICLTEGEACDLRATQLSCCRQYCHKRCLDKWYERGHQTCPFCRQLADVPENHDMDPIPPVPGNLSRDEVIERLDQLLSNVNLRQEIEQVSNCFFVCFLL